MNVYPSFICNLRCPFCSIRKDESSLLSLEYFDTLLQDNEVLRRNINILGGEPSILPVDYQRELISICKRYSGEKPYYVTNLIAISPVIEDVNPIVSYDFSLRSQHTKILNNILSLNVDYAISTILSKHLVEEVGAFRYLSFVHKLKRCARADLVLYFHSDTDPIDCTPDHEKLMEFVSIVMNDPKICLTPYRIMKRVVPKQRENVSDFLAVFPDNTIGLRVNHHNTAYIPYKTVAEAVADFNDKINTNPLCSPCRFQDYCWYPYTGACNGDKEMMELFISSMKG